MVKYTQNEASLGVVSGAKGLRPSATELSLLCLHNSFVAVEFYVGFILNPRIIVLTGFQVKGKTK